jgi:hypothetical protein
MIDWQKSFHLPGGDVAVVEVTLSQFIWIIDIIITVRIEQAVANRGVTPTEAIKTR